MGGYTVPKMWKGIAGGFSRRPGDFALRPLGANPFVPPISRTRSPRLRRERTVSLLTGPSPDDQPTRREESEEAYGAEHREGGSGRLADRLLLVIEVRHSQA